MTYSINAIILVDLKDSCGYKRFLNLRRQYTNVSLFPKRLRNIISVYIIVWVSSNIVTLEICIVGGSKVNF